MGTSNGTEGGRFEAHSHRPTFLELFFDLVFVFALTRISARAFEDLALETGGAEFQRAVPGAARSFLLLLALYAVWQGTAWTTSRYNPYQPAIQVIVLIAMVGSMVMGVAIPRAFTTGGLAFTFAYVTVQISRPLILFLVLRHRPQRFLKLRMLVCFTCTAPLWFVGAYVDRPFTAVLWSIALIIEYSAARFGWPVPGMGRSPSSRWDIAGAHLAERYQQFFLISLGETILVAGFAYSAIGFQPGPTVAFAVALATSMLLWRIYFHRAGQVLAEAVAVSRQPARIGQSAAESHLVMVAGVVATAIGYELVIAHPSGPAPASWIVVVVGGPVLFVLGRARFEHDVFGRVSRARIVTLLALALPVPVLLTSPALASAITVLVILLGAAVADALRSRGVPPEAAAPPF
ncbi:low temperature requirement protein A [Micromonospora echinofusca]|uniref:Low temperature requirement protein A n=2 Tax=Micromonospora echinofusca TaxID=47858 RepID=A0ABS3W1M8_MICEH|nr:low temperature requirement protein A [Micromonospora echinofusca]